MASEARQSRINAEAGLLRRPSLLVATGSDPITGQTGRLFLPFDVMVGRAIVKDTVVSLEIGVPIIKDYPVYNLKTQLRLNATW